MDERFRGMGRWIALGTMAFVFLCVMLCALGAFGMLVLRSGPAYGVVPPSGEGGAALPPAGYHLGPLDLGRHGGGGLFGILGLGLLLMLFFGLLALLLLGPARRLFRRRMHPCPPYPPYWGKPADGEEGKGKAHAWGPRAWHHHPKHWGPPPGWAPGSEPASEEGKPASESDGPDSAESEYTGPDE